MIEREDMIAYCKSKHLSLRRILCSVLDKKIIKIRYLRNICLRQVPEYKFNMLEYNIVFDDYSNSNLYIRMIDKDKIEENLFCYWLFYEKNFKKICEKNSRVKTNFSNSKANIINCISQKYESKYKLQFLEINNNICEDSIVDIIDLNTYCNEKLNIYNNHKNDSNLSIEKSLFIAFK